MGGEHLIPLKKPRSYEEQITLLRNKNLLIKDEEFAKQILIQTGYYRLSGYYYFFYENPKTSKKFVDGTTIEDIYNLYRFDKELRSILFDLTSLVEIQLKSKLSYHLAHSYGEECWKNHQVIKQDQQLYILEKIKKSDSKSIKHHTEKYDGHYPIWVVLEILSFGGILNILQNLNSDDKKTISNTYDFKPYYVISWIESVYKLRNNCAHHERIVGRVFKVKLDKSMKAQSSKDSLFIMILAIKKLTKGNLDCWSYYQKKLKNLLEEPDFSQGRLENLTEKLGFPTNWDEILSQVDL